MFRSVMTVLCVPAVLTYEEVLAATFAPTTTVPVLVKVPVLEIFEFINIIPALVTAPSPVIPWIMALT